jgi:UDP-N-acetylmuramate dehydrogenase
MFLRTNRTHQSDFYEPLREQFGERVQEDASLARYTSTRVGGAADVLITVRSSQELEEAVSWLWKEGFPFLVLGGGSNVLVHNSGFRGVVVLNRAQKIQIDEKHDPPVVWAESGAGLGLVARQVSASGWSGLEWAAGIPGTVGGAVVGNAGAHGSDMAQSIFLAEILHHYPREKDPALKIKKECWAVEKMAYKYRSSILKSHPGKAVVLGAALRLVKPDAGSISDIQARMNAFGEQRRRTQPPGASMGSMFKNPPGDYAGRLIEEAGLKGMKIGSAEISPLHGNFFINHGGASSGDIYALIRQTKKIVFEKFGVELELEIELVGAWDDEAR